jgi:choline-sulfatase
MADRPNILFLHIDQQNLKAANGCPYVSTPNLDRIFARGVSFRNAVSANPVCSPSRSSWYTGLMSEEHGQLDNGNPGMDRSIPDIGPLISSGGYDSVYMGKWHLARPVEDSFDRAFSGHGHGEVGDAYVARAAEAFLANREGDKPFFLNVGLLNPHDCCMWGYDFTPGPAKYGLASELADELPPLPPNHDLGAFPTLPETPLDPTQGKWSDLDWRFYMYSYYRQVEMVDAEVGRIVDALEQSRFADNTLLIFSSDHGDGVAQHHHYGKVSPLDPSLIVPLVLVHPGVPARIDTTHMISNIDVTATICDYAGVDPLPGRKGLSLRPLLEGRETSWRPYAASNTARGRIRLVRTPEYKLINNRITNDSALYDLVNDPWEMKDVIADPAHAQARAQMRNYLDANEATYHYAPQMLQQMAKWKKAGGGDAEMDNTI